MCGSLVAVVDTQYVGRSDTICERKEGRCLLMCLNPKYLEVMVISTGRAKTRRVIILSTSRCVGLHRCR
jgi:hypothetical protein